MLALATVVAGQGEALALRYPARSDETAAQLQWNEHAVALRRTGGDWVALIGIDLDLPAGPHAALVRFEQTDGSVREQSQPIVVERRDFPMTRLTVEPKYVEPDPADLARANRESQEIAAIYGALDPTSYWSEPFVAPLPGVTGGRNFGHRRVFNGQPRAPHSGADLPAAAGTEVHAANRGRVVLAKNLFFSGNAVFIDHGSGLFTTYLHLSEIRVEPGEIVQRGQIIGLAGATGRVTGPHLHWGVRILGARVDPFSLLASTHAGGTGAN